MPGVDKGGNVRNLGYVPTEMIANLKDIVFKGPFRDQGMPDFTGKLTEADMTKIAGLHPGHRGRDPAEAVAPTSPLRAKRSNPSPTSQDDCFVASHPRRRIVSAAEKEKGLREIIAQPFFV